MTRSFTDLSFLSASTLCLKFSTTRLKLKVLLNSKLLNQISERHTNAMIRVDLKMLLGCHIPHRGGVPQSLCLHDPFHVGSPAILRKNRISSLQLCYNGFSEAITCDVTMQQGEDTSRLETTTFSIFLSRMSFITCTLRNVANWC